jgi:hypothetical protein
MNLEHVNILHIGREYYRTRNKGTEQLNTNVNASIVLHGLLIWLSHGVTAYFVNSDLSQKGTVPKKGHFEVFSTTFFFIHDMDLKFHTIQGYAFMYMQVKQI